MPLRLRVIAFDPETAPQTDAQIILGIDMPEGVPSSTTPPSNYPRCTVGARCVRCPRPTADGRRPRLGQVFLLDEFGHEALAVAIESAGTDPDTAPVSNQCGRLAGVTLPREPVTAFFRSFPLESKRRHRYTR